MNTIFEKHWDALVTTAESTSALSLPAVRLALHLAIRDAHEAGREMWCSDALDLNQDRDGWRSLAEGLKADVADLHQRLAAALEQCDSQALRIVSLGVMVAEQPGYEEQQNRLMRWILDNDTTAPLGDDVAGMIIAILDKQRQDLSALDTALANAQNEAGMLRQRNANLQAEQGAASVDPTPTPDWGPSHPAWQALTAEEQETIAKLAAGAIRFRSVPKARRLILIGQVLRHIGSGNSKITMAQYNNQRPAWMAEATSITQYVESNKWQDVVTVAMLYTQTAAAQ